MGAAKTVFGLCVFFLLFSAPVDGHAQERVPEPIQLLCEKEIDSCVAELNKLGEGDLFLPLLKQPVEVEKVVNERRLHYSIRFSTRNTFSQPGADASLRLTWLTPEEWKRPRKVRYSSLVHEFWGKKRESLERPLRLHHVSPSGILVTGRVKSLDEERQNAIADIFLNVIDHILKWEKGEKLRAPGKDPSKEMASEAIIGLCEKEFNYFVREVKKVQAKIQLNSPALSAPQNTKEKSGRTWGTDYFYYHYVCNTNELRLLPEVVRQKNKDTVFVNPPYLSVDFDVQWRAPNERKNSPPWVIVSMEKASRQRPLSLHHISRSGILVTGRVNSLDKGLQREIEDILLSVVDHILQWEKERTIKQ